MIIYGQAGSGKSEIIKAILEDLKNKCLVACFSAKAGFGIGGSTLHSLIKIQLADLANPKPLTPKQLEQIQQSFEGVTTLIIDEIGMIGKLFLWHINYNLQQALDPIERKPFGGLNVILVGDHHQLKPIGD